MFVSIVTSHFVHSKIACSQGAKVSRDSRIQYDQFIKLMTNIMHPSEDNKVFIHCNDKVMTFKVWIWHLLDK